MDNPLLMNRTIFQVNIGTPGNAHIKDQMLEAFDLYSIPHTASSILFMETLLREAKGMSERSTSKPEDVQTITDLKNELERLENENHIISRELITERKKLEGQTTLLYEANEQVDSLSTENEQLTEQLETLQNDFNNANYQVTQLQGKLPDTETTVVLESSPANIFLLNKACETFKMTPGKLLLDEIYIPFLIHGPSDLQMPFKNFTQKKYLDVCQKLNVVKETATEG